MDFLEDKSWMYSTLNRVHDKNFQDGVKKFIEFALGNSSNLYGLIACPCKICCNRYNKKADVVFDHLILKGFTSGYLCWVHHGEAVRKKSTDKYTSEMRQDRIHGLLRDTCGVFDNNDHNNDTNEDIENEPSNLDAEKFFKLLKDADQPLYHGCKRYTKLSFIVKLLHMKVLFGWSDNSMTELLLLLKDVLPDGCDTFPSSFYEAKYVIRELGLDYNTIDACPNDCMLFWKESKEKNKCDYCHASRYKEDSDGNDKTKKEPVKVLRHFPLTPRLQRMFMNADLSKQMQWHATRRVDDGLLRHPADSAAWKQFDLKYPIFADDPRNVKLGLASDGFNPFGNMNNAYSVWPVIVIPYNLPPWLCMKQQNFILTLLIPGKRSPGKDIDVYLQPLIDELKQLWNEGVLTYDAQSKSNFMLHAMVLWTDPEFIAKSEINKQNRGKKVFNHRSGAKSIAKIRENFRREYGREPTTVEVLKVLYPSDDIAEDIETQIVEIQEREDNSEGIRPIRDIEEAAYARVMQPVKLSYIHNVGIGHDICPKRSISTKINEDKQSNVEKETIKELKEQLATQKEKQDAQDATLKNVNQQLQQVAQFMGFFFASQWQHGTNMFRGVSSSLSGCGTHVSDGSTQSGAPVMNNNIGGANNISNPFFGLGGSSSIPTITPQFPFNIFSTQTQNFAFPHNIIGDCNNTQPNVSSQQGANTTPSPSPSPSNLPNGRGPRSLD